VIGLLIVGPRLLGVQENIAGQELLFLPSLKRAEEVIAARIKKLCASPANQSPRPPLRVGSPMKTRIISRGLPPARSA
jgi:hypothetical protein